MIASKVPNTLRKTTSGRCWAQSPPKYPPIKKAKSDQQAGFQIDISCLVILPEGERANGQQQRRQRCSLGLVLAHVKEIDRARE